MPLHFEPFVHLAGLTHDDALIAWGGFWFRCADDPTQPWQIVESPAMSDHDGIDRRHSIGVDSEPYGSAVVEVHDADTGHLVARSETDQANWTWVRGLRPDTDYRYRITVDGERWAGGPLHRLQVGQDGGYRLVPSERRYDNRFRTFPPPDRRTPVSFAVLGDYGLGLLAVGGDRQALLARSLEAAVDHHSIRFVLTTGDNVYVGQEGTVAGTGGEDDDWYFSFYEPYRHIINRVPVYPSVGNHDASDTERSDDRQQIDRNFFTDARFADDVEAGRASVDPGLFYRFRYGADVELTCIDTTLASGLEEYDQYFEAPNHQRFLDEAFPPLSDQSDDAPRWRIPFAHHPPFCAGPSHPNMQPMVDHLVPRLERAGVALMLSGHEHNFQWSQHNGVDYVVTGAGGKLREEPPTNFDEAHTVAWGAERHLLLVDLDGPRGTVRPVVSVAPDGRITPLAPCRPDGGSASDLFEVRSPVNVTA